MTCICDTCAVSVMRDFYFWTFFFLQDFSILTVVLVQGRKVEVEGLSKILFFRLILHIISLSNQLSFRCFRSHSSIVSGNISFAIECTRLELREIKAPNEVIDNCSCVRGSQVTRETFYP